MIGALSDQLALPLDTAHHLEPANAAGSPCCSAPFCTGCTADNFLSPNESQLMRRHLRRLLAPTRTRPVTP